ncbi:MAG: hypothetical protein ACJ762_17850 [Solirubrobacteraceae bacterium]
MQRLLVVLIVAFLAAPAAADARIVVQKSIAGVSVGMSRAKLVERKGQPLRRRSTGKGTYQVTLWSFAGPLDVGFQRRGPKVTSVTTYDATQRTASGIGPGSTRKQVRAALKGERCNEFGCAIGSLAPDTVYTEFDFGSDGAGPVEWVAVGRTRPAGR